MKKGFKRLLGITLGLTLIGGVGFSISAFNKGSIESSASTPAVGTTYKRVTSVDELVVGANYALVSTDGTQGDQAASTELKENYRTLTKIQISSGTFTSTATVLNLQLGGSSGAWTFLTTNYLGDNGYLNATDTTTGRMLRVIAEDDAYNKFSISFNSSKFAKITCTGKTTRNVMKYMMNSNIISCYDSDATGSYYLSLYKAIVTAKDWADDFLAVTATPCAESTQDHQAALEAVWNSTVTKYNLLSDDQKEILKTATYETADVGEAVERYDTIIKKYASSSSIITNYIDRTITLSNKSMLWVDTTTIIISVVALTGVSAVAVYLFTKKLKHK